MIEGFLGKHFACESQTKTSLKQLFTAHKVTANIFACKKIPYLIGHATKINFALGLSNRVKQLLLYLENIYT